MKYTLTAIALFLGLFSASRSPAQNWMWSKGNTGVNVDAWPVAVDKFGNVFTAGFRLGAPPAVFGTTVVPSTGTGVGYQCLIAKYDAAGNLLWAKGATNGESNLIGLATDPSGNVYMFGTMYTVSLKLGSITLTNTSGSDAEYFLAKYDPSGNVLWAVNAGNTQLGITLVSGMAKILGLGAITTDAAGNVYITTNFHMVSTKVGAYTLPNSGLPGTDDILLAKYDPSGNVLWAKSAGGTKNDDAFAITVTPAGDIYIAGAFNSPSIAFGTSAVANTSVGTISFIARYDANGNPVWADASGGNGKDYAAGLAADVANNVYLTGGFDDNSITFRGTPIANPNVGNSAQYLVKFDPSNYVSWHKAIGSPLPGGFALGFAVTTSFCGEVWIAGAMSKHDSVGDSASVIPIQVSIDGNVLSEYPACEDPLFLAGFTSGGTYVGGTTLHSGGDDQVGLASDEHGNIYLSGDYLGDKPFSIGESTFPIDTSVDELMYIAKYSPRNIAQIYKHSDTTFCFKTGISVYAPGGYGVYLWNDGHKGVSHSVSDTGIFWVWGYDSCAAYVMDTFRVSGICDCDKSLFVPNTFTPNGDGQNDMFYPRGGSGITKITTFRVYNRWGTLLFERENISPNDIGSGWDGSYQGNLPLPDVYVYIVDALCENGKVINKKGSVTVIR